MPQKGNNHNLRISKKFQPLTQFGHKTQQIIMPIVVIADDEMLPLGTGFMINPDGLMMTAKHVIQDVAEKNLKSRKTGNKYKQLSLFAFYITDQKHPNKEEYLGGLWPIQSAWYSDELDIAYCWLRQAKINDEPIKFPVLRLSPGIPKIGEKILGFGYYKGLANITDEIIDAKIAVDYEHKTAFTQGEIVDVHPIRRDRGMYSFPCFQTNARFEGGMSGGPIFNEQGYVCGVICGSDGRRPYSSYCSLLWPALGTSIEVALTPGALVSMHLVYDLAKKGLIITDDSINQVQVILREDNSRIVILKESPVFNQ